MTAAQNSNQFFISEPNWQTYKRTPYTAVPPRMRGWLLDRGSLTQRLIDLSDGNFHVEILRQQIAYPTLSESRVLKLPLRQKAFIRQVALHSHGVPLVYARSVIPLKTLTGRLRSLRNLKNKPLGALLFKDSAMKRGPIETGCTKSYAYASQEFFNKTVTTVWGRRSLFYLDKKPLLVSEQFMPDFDQKTSQKFFK